MNPRISPLTMKYECPQLSLLIITPVEDQRNKTRVLSRYSMLMYSERVACFEHSNFFKVTSPTPRPDQSRPDARPRPKRKEPPVHTTRGGPPTPPKINYELFNCNNLNIRYWAGITAAAGTRLALNGSSLRDLDCTHSITRLVKAQYCYLLSLPPRVGIG
ncbi:hypothetical protein Mapa_013407 [Marchantia paleacea]|nr:hypothetical protein Mapa_013407 [Marchantia paleacea]